MGNTCYLGSVLQSLLHSDCFIDDLLKNECVLHLRSKFIGSSLSSQKSDESEQQSHKSSFVSTLSNIFFPKPEAIIDPKPLCVSFSSLALEHVFNQ